MRDDNLNGIWLVATNVPVQSGLRRMEATCTQAHRSIFLGYLPNGLIWFIPLDSHYRWIGASAGRMV